jgi:hypothetical protein
MRWGLIVERGVESSVGEYGFRCERSVQGPGHAAVDGGVQEGFDYFVGGQSDVECGVDVDGQLGFAAA